MTLRKRLLKTTIVQACLAWLAALYIRLIRRTTRWHEERPAATEEILARRQAYIGCFWHGRMLLMGRAIPGGQPLHLLISGHRDGLLISRGVAHLGVPTVSGSTRRGGASALRAIQKVLGAGDAVGITPDGPRGPRMRAKLGAIKAAQMTGAPILPVSGSATRRRILRSWDRFCLALPFGRGLLLWGEPIRVPADADAAALEAFRLSLEETLNGLTAEAERRCGQTAVEPAREGENDRVGRRARA